MALAVAVAVAVGAAVATAAVVGKSSSYPAKVLRV